MKKMLIIYCYSYFVVCKKSNINSSKNDKIPKRNYKPVNHIHSLPHLLKLQWLKYLNMWSRFVIPEFMNL